MKFLIKSSTGFGILLLVICQGIIAQVRITINATPPVSPFLNQVLKSFGPGINVSLQNPPNSTISQVYVTGILRRLAPSLFTIKLRPSYKPEAPIVLSPGQSKQLLNNEIEYAFGNYDENTLDFTGITTYDLKEGFNYRLPEGAYQICFTAKDYRTLKDVSQEVCATFNICYRAAAPQFMQPVNNFTIGSLIPTVRPDTRIMFAWTQPNATCGGLLSALRFLNYDFEIREVFNNQTVTDAIRNPYIFQKTALTTNTFLLDTNLYKNVLQRGKKYVMRVRANVPGNSSVLVDNSGYSRIEAFQYGDNYALQTDITTAVPKAISYEERNTAFWIEVFKAYEKDKKRDTLVPIKEYIPLILTYHGIVYSDDAIQMLYALNPELKNITKVKLSYSLNLPEFARVTETERKNFELEHAVNLEPDTREERRFTLNLDTFKTIISRHEKPEIPWSMLYNPVNHLNEFRLKAQTINRVSMNIINNLMSAIIVQLRTYPSRNNKNEFKQLQLLVSDLDELIISSTNETSFLEDVQLQELPRYNGPTFANYISNTIKAADNESPSYYVPYINQLISFDVIVWHFNNATPPVSVYNTPALERKYAVYYVEPGLYNEQNPKNKARTSGPTSTSHVSLPNAKFLFWTENMITHLTTKPIEQYTQELFHESRKDWPTEIKNFKIVLKVEDERVFR